MFANNADDILARSTVETWVIKGEKGDVDVCKKCEGKVYEAEKLTTAAVRYFIIHLLLVFIITFLIYQLQMIFQIRKCKPLI